MAEAIALPIARLDPRKFRDPLVTATGERRARVALGSLATLWFNTGTLCNLTCGHCYIESSPKNDRLVYLSTAEVAEYLNEIENLGLGTKLIAFTGGEQFRAETQIFDLVQVFGDLGVASDAGSRPHARLPFPGADQRDEAD